MITKYKTFFLGLFGVVFFSCAQEKIVEPRTYVAYKTSEEIIIDGYANEESWEKTTWTKEFIDIQGEKKTTYKTHVKMLWNEECFYIFAKLEEPHVWADIKEHDAIVFHNNDFEVFLDPENNNHGYYEIEMNALNTVWDLFITKPYRELKQPVLNGWNATGLKSAIQINGTLNNPNDVDEGWTVELAIPWKTFRTSYFQDNVPRDKFWRVNFSRVNWDYQLNEGKYERKKDKEGKLQHEYNWVWSPQGVVNMHEPEKWGYVFFSTKEVGAKEEFEIPDDERIKWKLFEIYRKQKAYYRKNKKWAHSIDELSLGNFKINNQIIKPKLENHSLGYNVTVESPFTGKSIIIREDGELIVK